MVIKLVYSVAVGFLFLLGFVYMFTWDECKHPFHGPAQPITWRAYWLNLRLGLKITGLLIGLFPFGIAILLGLRGCAQFVLQK